LRRLALLLTLLAALAAAPSANAHIEGFSQARSLLLGPYAAYVDPQPTNVYANNSISFSALVSDNATGNYVTTLGATMVMRGPDNWSKSLDMAHDPTGYLVGSFILPARGNYSATFILHAPNGTDYSQSTTFTAYPDLPVRIQSADLQQDVTTGSRTVLAIETVDPITGQRVDKLNDLQMNVERWSNDHSQLFDQQQVTLKHQSKGLWTYDYNFPKASMYHLRFASRSGGFNYDDVPILHLYATDPPPADAGGKHLLPGPELGLGVVAVAIAGWTLRRR